MSILERLYTNINFNSTIKNRHYQSWPARQPNDMVNPGKSAQRRNQGYRKQKEKEKERERNLLSRKICKD